MDLNLASLCGNLLALLLLVFALVYLYFKYAYTYWSRRGVPYLEPKFPLGNLKTFVLKSYALGSHSADYYNEFKRRGEKFGGIYIANRPVLVLTDPDIIKDVMTKDFHNFIDRGTYTVAHDPITNHLFNMDQTRWKKMRTYVTPTFTSGKMKMMFNIVLQCSHYMNDFMDKKVELQEDIDILEVLASFTTDVIGACAFGLDCNSFSDTDSEFRKFGRTLFSKRSLLGRMKLLFIAAMPELAQSMKLKVAREEQNKFLFSIVEKSLKYRETNNVRRPDFLQLMIDLYKEDPSFSFGDLVAQVFVFFVAGFDTSSATMKFTLYELAKNQDLQERAREEILRVLEKHDNKVTYEVLSEMTFLEQCLDETLRMYPPVLTLTRKCIKDYKIRDSNVMVEKGTMLYIPLYGMHRDPEHFPEPDVYNPDRFDPKNPSKHHPFAYLPFGEGPRNCVGLRFGKMQSKIGLINILKAYRLTVSPNSPKQQTIDGTVFLIKTLETLLLRAEKV